MTCSKASSATTPRGGSSPASRCRWTASADGLAYEFRLRNSVWSNGDPLTAEDFVFAFRRLLDPATAAPYASLFSRC